MRAPGWNIVSLISRNGPFLIPSVRGRGMRSSVVRKAITTPGSWLGYGRINLSLAITYLQHRLVKRSCRPSGAPDPVPTSHDAITQWSPKATGMVWARGAYPPHMLFNPLSTQENEKSPLSAAHHIMLCPTLQFNLRFSQLQWQDQYYHQNNQ